MPGPKRWDKDTGTLDRLHEHARLVRQAGGGRLGRELVIRVQGIDERTYYRDQERLLELRRRAIGKAYDELLAAVDAGYCEMIEDADRFTAEARTPNGKALHQSNKLHALDSRTKLHGLAKTASSASLPDGSQVRRIVIEEIAYGTTESAAAVSDDDVVVAAPPLLLNAERSA